MTSNGRDGDGDANRSEEAAATRRTARRCGCPNECAEFESLPSDRGIMIALHHPLPGGGEGDGGAGVERAPPTCRGAQGSSTDSDSDGCTCLKLHPQADANYPDFHPNIYIPESLLDYPDRLVKYGGGGELWGEELWGLFVCISIVC